MRDSNKLTYSDLFMWGFYKDPVYDYDKHQWHIERYNFLKGKSVNQPIGKAWSRTKYAPRSMRYIISFKFEGKTITIPLAKFIYVYFDPSHVLEANYYTRIDPEKEDPYLYENIWIETKEQVEKHKNKGNQYFSEKWNILPKN